MAVATRPVFTRKYAVAAPTSGRATADKSCAAPGSPNQRMARPALSTVSTSAAILNIVRYTGLRSLLFRWHWQYALATATTIVACGPRSSSDAKSTAYDTDIVEPLVVIGSVTFRAADADATATSATKSTGCCEMSTFGRHTAIAIAPATITDAT